MPWAEPENVDPHRFSLRKNVRCQLTPNAPLYSLRGEMPIRSMRPNAVSRLFEAEETDGSPPGQGPKLRRVLAALDAASDVEEMKAYPGWPLHPLKGDPGGFWSISISGNWRLIFRFEDGDAFDVDLIGYH